MQSSDQPQPTMFVWLVNNVYGERLRTFSSREKALAFIAAHSGGVVTPFTPSTNIYRSEIDADLPAIAA